MVAFINDDPKKRRGHWWDKEFGIVDFSFTKASGDASAHYSELQKKLKETDLGPDSIKVEYESPVAGARIRPDGQEIKWEVTFPKVTTGYQRGELPFFTQDITPRSLRAPFSEESVTHPSSALGVKCLSNFIQEGKIAALSEAYSVILGVPSTAAQTTSQTESTFEVRLLNEVDGLHKAKLLLKTPNGSQFEEARRRGGSLLGDLTFGIPAALGGTKVPRRIDVGEQGVGGVYLDVY